MMQLTQDEACSLLRQGYVFDCKTPKERNELLYFFTSLGYGWGMDTWCREHVWDDTVGEENTRYLAPYMSHNELHCMRDTDGIRTIVYFEQVRHLVETEEPDMTDEEFEAAFAELIGGGIAV